MSVLTIVSVGVVVVALMTANVVRYAMQEVRDFRVDFSQTAGKVVVITGANSGLGYHTARALAEHGARVIMACRSMSKCEEARQNILQQHANADVTCQALDLASFASIYKFAQTFSETHDYLDVLVNNAGVMAVPTRQETEDKLEFQIGTNHFGHFLLTSLLFPLLSPTGRVINHSSGAHLFHGYNFPHKDLQSVERYDPWTAYGNSKQANLLFTYGLQRRVQQNPATKDVKVIAVHPGYTSTNLQTGKIPMWEMANEIFAMKGPDGALSQIYAAVDPSAQSSVNTFIGPRFVMFGAPAVSGTRSTAWDEDAQEALWSASVKLTGHDILLSKQ